MGGTAEAVDCSAGAVVVDTGVGVGGGVSEGPMLVGGVGDGVGSAVDVDSATGVGAGSAVAVAISVGRVTGVGETRCVVGMGSGPDGCVAVGCEGDGATHTVPMGTTGFLGPRLLTRVPGVGCAGRPGTDVETATNDGIGCVGGRATMYVGRPSGAAIQITSPFATGTFPRIAPEASTATPVEAGHCRCTVWAALPVFHTTASG